MEFGSYFSGSYIESNRLVAFWPYPATVSGDFSVNNPTVGSFPTTQVMQQSLSLPYGDDFSLFMTIDSGVISSPPQFQFRTQVLVSCADYGGWDFGILASNEFFISSPEGEIYNFDQIHLGTKNCFCLKKSGQSFTVYKYDIYSRAIESEQTIFFGNDVNLDSGGTLLVGYNFYSDIGGYSYSWYGQVDQLSLVNEPLDRASIKNLFAGFEPVTYNISTTYSDDLIDYVWRPENVNSEYVGLLDPLIDNVKQYVFGLDTGNYISFFSGNVGASFIGSGNFVSGVNLCYGSGESNLFTYNSSSGVSTGMFPSGWYVTDTIRSNTYLAGTSTAYHTETLVTHNFNIYNNTGSVAKLAYDELFYKGYPTHITGITTDSGYYSGFYMNGVSQNNYYNNSILLGALTGAIPTGVNIIGQFDQVSGLFSVMEQNGYYFYNGMKVPSTGFNKNGEYIDIISVSETDTDGLIYDMYSGLSLLYFGLQGFATGDYFPRTATPYTGQSSFSEMYRNFPQYYHETSRLHMYHGQPVLYQSNSGEVDNLNNYWF